MARRFLPVLIALLVILLAAADKAFAQAATGLRLFEQHCTNCHSSATVPAGTPDGLQLRKMTPEGVYAALSEAPHVASQGPTDNEKRLIAEYLGGRKVDIAKVADARLMPNQCRSNPAIGDLSASPSWNGWGVDPSTNARFQPAKAAGLPADQVPRLKLKWAFGFPGAEMAWGQPTIAAGRVFIGVDTGAVYSLDAATGCVYWSFQSDAGVRNAISIGPVKGQGSAKHAAYFGDVKANVYGIDAASGKLLWKVKVEDQPVARITGASTLYDGRLYVPVSSSEERAAGLSDNYPCCTFRGSVVALDANTGRQLWKTYIIPDAPKPAGRTSKGVQPFAPSGGAVWNSPTIDVRHRALYIGTGDSYNPPVPKTTDAIMALDIGGAADEENAYFGLRTGGVAAVQLATGEKKWFTPIPVSQAPGQGGGETAALTAIPGAVFSGGQDGVVRALSAKDGRLLWEYNTIRDFETVNGVAAKGGSMGPVGPTVAGGTLFVGSGYTFGVGTTGNVLLAFSVQ